MSGTVGPTRNFMSLNMLNVGSQAKRTKTLQNVFHWCWKDTEYYILQGDFNEFILHRHNNISAVSIWTWSCPDQIWYTFLQKKHTFLKLQSTFDYQEHWDLANEAWLGPMFGPSQKGAFLLKKKVQNCVDHELDLTCSRKSTLTS